MILEENGERESVCLLLSAMCSNICFVREIVDSCCCFIVLSPHGFYHTSITVALVQLFAISHCDSLHIQAGDK